MSELQRLQKQISFQHIKDKDRKPMLGFQDYAK